MASECSLVEIVSDTEFKIMATTETTRIQQNKALGAAVSLHFEGGREENEKLCGLN